MKKNNTICGVDTYVCPICGTEFPVRFAVDASYGHVCYSCAQELRAMWIGQKDDLLGTTAWNGTTITNDMGKEASELLDEKFDDGEKSIHYSNFFNCVRECFFTTFFHEVVDGWDWRCNYDVICAEVCNEDYCNEPFEKEEVMICVLSLIKNNIAKFNEARKRRESLFPDLAE